jgi:hypothetical protein
LKKQLEQEKEKTSNLEKERILKEAEAKQH